MADGRRRSTPRRGSASTWLLTLVHRRAVDVVRREDRRRGLPLDDAPVASGDATDETAETRELRREVQAALEQLTPLEREALELAYYGGLSQSEIAEKLGVPLGTVKSRMFAGLARLRDVLGDTSAVVLPLFDNVPVRRFAIVTYALIAANLAVFIWELGARGEPDRPLRVLPLRGQRPVPRSRRPTTSPGPRACSRGCSCTRAGCTCSGTCCSSGSSGTTSRT